MVMLDMAGTPGLDSIPFASLLWLSLAHGSTVDLVAVEPALPPHWLFPNTREEDSDARGPSISRDSLRSSQAHRAASSVAEGHPVKASKSRRLC